jgi:hypothetical protein
MTTREVRTQAELDKAIDDKVDWIDIRSPAGVWLDVVKNGSSTVTAYGSSTVRAYGSSTVTACGSSTVTAYGSSTVTACGSSTVTAYGSSTVRACDSSTVTACGSSTVTAYGSSTVTACDSSTVRACDSSTVRAYGSSTVRAYGSSTVRATPLVAIHLHSATVKVAGGVVLDHSNIRDFDAKQWCEYHGVKVSRGIATLYKAVNNKWTTDRGTDYSPGSKPSCDDFRDTDACGNGLHFGPTPVHALAYFREATKFVAVGVRLDELRPINGDTAKAKAPRVVRACVEVDIDGNVIAAQAAA